MRFLPKRFVFPLYLICVVTIGVEFFTQFLIEKNDQYYIYPPYYKFMQKSNPEFTPGVYTDAHFRANELGIRSESYQGQDNVILILGGSTAIDVMLDQELTWAYQLQRLLTKESKWVSTWVGNLGNSARASENHVDYMEKIFPYMPKPDFILVLLGANDMQLALKSSYGDGELNDHNLLNYNVHPDNDFISNFGIYRFYRQMHQWYLRDKYAFIGNGAGFKQWRDCRQSAPAHTHVDKLPDLSEMQQVMWHSLESMEYLSRQYKAKIIFITQPTLYNTSVGDAEKSVLMAGGVGPNQVWCKDKKYYSIGALAKAMIEFNNITRRFCKTKGLDCIDLAKKLPPKLDNYYDEMHYSELGALKVATVIAQEMSKMK